ncbi:MAG: hypothetical protein HY261_06735, partial [Chloroflexi bacterium]|nr:hypothetical protein [Chloroflexota bacterium]
AGRALPYVDGIDMAIISDVTLAQSAFRAGRLQCSCPSGSDFMTDGLEQLQKEIPGVNLGLTYPAPHILQFNLQRPPFSNAAFRQAVAIGFDKEKVSAVWRSGKNYRPGPPLYPPENGGRWGLPKSELVTMAGYNPNHAADVALAQQKFKESGIDPKSVQLEMLYSTFFGPEGDLLVTVLGELGLQVKATPLGGADYAKRRGDGTFDIAHHTPGIGIDDPADGYTSLMATGGTSNFGKYSNAKVDQMLKDQDVELDVAKRRAILWDVQKINLTDFPTAPFFWGGAVYGARPEVKNFKTPPLSVHAAFRMDEVWLEQ